MSSSILVRNGLVLNCNLNTRTWTSAFSHLFKRFLLETHVCYILYRLLHLKLLATIVISFSINMQHYRVVPHCIQCHSLQSKAVNNKKKTNSNFPLLNSYSCRLYIYNICAYTYIFIYIIFSSATAALQSQLFLHFNTSPTPRQQQHCQRLRCYNINDNSKPLHMHTPPRTCRTRHNCVACAW